MIPDFRPPLALLRYPYSLKKRGGKITRQSDLDKVQCPESGGTCFKMDCIEMCHFYSKCQVYQGGEYEKYRIGIDGDTITVRNPDEPF